MPTTDTVDRPFYRFRDHELRVTRGQPLPLGASRVGDGVNFVLICRHGTSVALVLSEPCNPAVAVEIPLHPRFDRLGDHWHIRVDGLPDEFCYGYRVDGPTGPRHRYDPSVVLIDPTCRALSCGKPWGVEGQAPRRSLVGKTAADLRDDIHPRTPRADTILYEVHVRGFTASASSGVKHPGTFRGLAEKAEYLRDLGVTAVELLPIDEFDEMDCPFVSPLTGEKLRNFWGYNTVAFAAVKAAYASNWEGDAPRQEFQRTVAALHQVGLEVILDVVFNHTAEGGEDGPSIHFRGLDNSLYYILDDQGRYLNYSGCGNAVNSNHPVVRSQILSCLRNAVVESGVDGFRFDLASVLGRDERGNVLVEPPVIEQITQDALLADTKMIAEPWDAAGLYQVGSFPGGHRWSVWNGQFRDDVRRFWRGDPGMTSALATRICGSDDLGHGRGPLHSINFVTCHDGFTLWDLVSYNDKHNAANGEGNRDGSDCNFSWNCGVEGPTENRRIIALRDRQARNLLATLLVAQGVPMLLGGDEVLRTQGGNNNAWCQDRAERRLLAVHPSVDRPPQAAPRPPAADLLRYRRPLDPRHRLARRPALRAGLLARQPLRRLRPRRPPRRPPRPGRPRPVHRLQRRPVPPGLPDPRRPLGSGLAPDRRYGAPQPRRRPRPRRGTGHRRLRLLPGRGSLLAHPGLRSVTGDSSG